MFALTESHRFLLYSQPTDMRKSFDALSGLIISTMNRNPLSGEVFIFVIKSGNLIKLLNFQQGGFVLYYKCLEKSTTSKIKLFVAKISHFLYLCNM